MHAPSGVRLVSPSLTELGRHLGLLTPASNDVYDLAIVGAGPAGLAACIRRRRASPPR